MGSRAAKGAPERLGPKGKAGHSRHAFLNGDDLRKAFEAGTRCLERQRDAINALNVFPVPDGDTGTNMLLTMRSVNQESFQTPGSSIGEVMAAMAHGALLGSRGNSGVILSQFFHGLSQGLQGKHGTEGEDLARAFSLASRAADSSVSKPVEGTMLTILRELSLAASQYVRRKEGDREVLSVWWAALEAAKDALSRTPQQLPVLRDAGVVDAGGQGVVTLLEGAARYLAGENVDDLELELCVPSDPVSSSAGVSVGRPSASPMVHEDYLAVAENELYGYCTQFLIQGPGLDVDRIRSELSDIAESTVVVGTEGLVKVHVHVHDPGPVISYAVGVGTIGQVSMDNIDQQHREFASFHRRQAGTLETPSVDSSSMEASSGPGGPPQAQKLGTAVVAVARGEGFVRLFNELGCETVVTGGQTMNPSTEELLNAARGTGAREVVLLPNNPNVIPAALQAASVTDQCGPEPPSKSEKPAQDMRLEVIPSHTLPQGLAALLAFNPEASLETNLKSMEGSLATVSTIEVTQAVRSSVISGLEVAEGQYIGLLEGDLIAGGDSALSVLQQALAKAMTVGDSQGESVSPEVLTLYWGADTEESHAREAEEQLRKLIPGVEIEVVYGGQPFYHYIASLE